jgi:hypothetical protein
MLTGLTVLVLVYCIFRHLNLAGGKGHFRAASMLIILSALSIVIAIVRLGIMISRMEEINLRLAFDSLTEFEAFIAGCAACIPAMRILVRGGGSKGSFGFPAGWGSFGNRLSRGSSIRSNKPTPSVPESEANLKDEKVEIEEKPAEVPTAAGKQPLPANHGYGVGMPQGWTDIGMEKLHV